MPQPQSIADCVSLCRTIYVNGTNITVYGEAWGTFAGIAGRLAAFLVTLVRLGNQTTELCNFADELQRPLITCCNLLSYCRDLGKIRAIVYEEKVFTKLRRTTESLGSLLQQFRQTSQRPTLWPWFQQAEGQYVELRKAVDAAKYHPSPLALACKHTFEERSIERASARAKREIFLNILLDHGGQAVLDLLLYQEEGRHHVQQELNVLRQEYEVAKNTGGAVESFYLSQVMDVLNGLLGNYGATHSGCSIDLSSLAATELEAPDDFLCPITQEVMSDPVTLDTGMTYDRQSIKDWFAQRRSQGLPLTCPNTNIVLQSATLTPSTMLRQKIEAWLAGGSRDMQNTSGTSVQGGGAETSLMQSVHTRGFSVATTSNVAPAPAVHNRGQSAPLIDLSGVCPQSRPVPFVTPASTPPQTNSYGTGNSSQPATMNISQPSRLPANPPLATVLDVLHSGSSVEVKAVERTLLDQDATVKLVAAGLLESLVHMLRTADLHVKARVASYLKAISSCSYPLKTKVANAAAIPLLVRMMESGDISCQEQASAALCMLAANHPGNRNIIVHEGGIHATLGLLGSLSDACKTNAAVLVASIATNSNANKARLGETTAIPALVRLLEHCTSHAIKEATATALRSLSLYEANLRKISSAGAIRPLVSLVQTGSPAAQEQAAGTLANLGAVPTVRHQINAANAILALISMFNSDSDSCREAAANALTVLAADGDSKQRILQSGVLRTLNDTVRTTRSLSESKTLRDFLAVLTRVV